MKLCFVDESWGDYLYWQKTDRKTLGKINKLIKEIMRTPYEGTGKPEALKHKYRGLWSLRIDQGHRLIYRVLEEEIWIVKCRFHYD